MSDRVGTARAGFARPSYRPERSGGLDPDLRRMALLALALGTALVLAIGASSMLRHRHHSVPVIEAQAGPVRIKPADPGGMKVMGADDLSPGTTERLAPPPERPQIAALRARVKAAKAATPATKPESAKAETVKTEATKVQAGPAAAAPPVQQTSATPALPVTAVQLAAFDTPELAEADWGHLAVKMPDLLGKRKPEVVRADLHGRPVWRLRTGGFASLAQAAEFCGKIRASGGDCSVAAF